MTKIDLLTMLTDSAVRYRKNWQDSLSRNFHMNKLIELCGQNCNLKEKVIQNVPKEVLDAILVDFINKIGVEQGVDYALYTKDLDTHKPKWE